MASVLANWGGYYSQRVYLTEARRLGLDLRPPHVNHSAHEFSVVYLDTAPVLYMGLSQVRELTQKTMLRMQQQRPFTSLVDFITRVDPRPKELASLVRVGAFTGMDSIPALLWQMEHPTTHSLQLPLFDVPGTGLPADLEDWSLAQQIAAQEALLGAAVSAHPLELYAQAIQTSGALSTVEALSQLNQRVRVAGMRQAWRRRRNRSGSGVYFMSLEDLEGMLDVLIPAEVYRRYRSAFANPGPYILEGILGFNPDTQEPLLRLERIENLTR
jgi:DNA polymerase III alpha subunit